MKTRNFALTISALALAASSFAASADVLFTNLGTAAPPASVGSHAVTPFDTAAQAAVSEYSNVSIIPGSPVAGDLTISPAANKRTVPTGWGSSWSDGYTGPVFFISASGSATLTLPPNTKAFYFYFEGNYYGSNTVTATTDSGATSGAVSVTTNPPGRAGAAAGFASHRTAAATITSITISAPSSGGFSVGEFGVNTGPNTTCASEGYTGTKLQWCKYICESELSSSQIDVYLRRWINRYHDLPYCAREEEPEMPPQEG
ncbi:MAG: hypothetical protein IPO74_06535 [Thermomonas sp.]|nr:hypothetical protein [Thermomonas sp.]